MSKIHSLDALRQKQLESFGVNNFKKFTSTKSAEKFLKTVGIALRYWRTERLPLASLYQAAWGRVEVPPKKAKDEPGKINVREEAQRRAIELTNHLLATHLGIEVNVIAGRIALVHRDLAPALYVLVRRHRPVTDLSDVSLQARKVFHWMEENKETTAGQVRKFLGIPATDLNNDPAYMALAELQSRMLVDRGPFIMRKEGIPYLSKEGYPYHCFHLAHQDLVKTSSRLSLEQAARDFLFDYLRGAVFATDKKLLSVFSGFLTRTELDGALEDLLKKRKVTVEKTGRDRIFVFKR